MNTRLDFVSVQVRDLEASKRYYTQVVGFEVTEGPPHAVIFRDEQGTVFAVRDPFPQTDVSKDFGVGTALWFAVADADAAHARMATSGAEVVSPPQPGPFGRVFTVRDPDGYLLSFHQA